MALIENESTQATQEINREEHVPRQPPADFWQGISPRAAFLLGLTCAIAGTSLLAFLFVMNSLLRR